MSSLNQLLAAHPIAGQRYADAVSELKAAFVDLAALERTLMNGNVDGGRSRNLPTFQAPNPGFLDARIHPVFAASVANEPGRSWWGAVETALKAKLAAYPTADE